MATVLNTPTTDASGQKLYVSGASPTDVSNAITSQHLTPTPSITLPSAPAAPNYGAAVAGGNAMIGANGASLASGTPTAPPAPTSDLSQLLQQYLAGNTPPPSTQSADQYNADQAAAGIQAKQDKANTDAQAEKDAQSKLDSINAQLAGVKAKGDAMNLNNSDREAPMFAIQGQEAENNRQIAIEALPLQAQALAAQAEVAAAQGNATLSQSILQQAQAHVDKLFQLHQQDAQAQYDYAQKQRDAVYNFATEAEKTKLAAQQKTADQAFTTQQNNLNQAQTFANTAITNGQPDIAAKLMALDPKDPNYMKNVSTLAGKIQTKAAPVSTSVNAKVLGKDTPITPTNADTSSATPPSWFKTQAENAAHANLTPAALQTAWDSYKKEAVNASTAKFFAPGASDKAALSKAMASDPAAAAQVDQKRLTTDPQYFYWVLAQLGGQ